MAERKEQGTVIGSGRVDRASTGQSLPLGFSIHSTLGGNWNDCLVRLALNVNQTGQLWVLDKLRFSN